MSLTKNHKKKIHLKDTTSKSHNYLLISNALQKNNNNNSAQTQRLSLHVNSSSRSANVTLPTDHAPWRHIAVHFNASSKLKTKQLFLFSRLNPN